MMDARTLGYGVVSGQFSFGDPWRGRESERVGPTFEGKVPMAFDPNLKARPNEVRKEVPRLLLRV